MPDGIGLEVVVILVLIVANGVFAAAEMGLVTARRSALQRQAEEGDERARAALALVNAPNEFLATVQIGITVIGTTAAAFGGASIARPLAASLRDPGVPLLARNAEGIALAAVVIAIAYLSLVLGELVPKRLALRNSDSVARRAAGPMRALSRLAHPLVRLLGVSTDLVLRLLGSRERREPAVTPEEIGYLLETGTRQGEIAPIEAELVQEVFEFTGTRARDAMTPRPDIVAVPDTATPEELAHAILRSGYSRIPVYHETVDHITGFVHAHDLLESCLRGEPLRLPGILRQPLLVPETITLNVLLNRFRHERTHLAIVLDEFGVTAGLITVEDVLEELVGDIGEEHREETAPVVRRSEDSWLIEGGTSLDAARDVLGVGDWPDRARLGYATLAGFVLARLQRIPHPGDSTEWHGYRFEVVDMDDHRIDQLLVTRVGSVG
ncbi:MAG: HlyC/CorC family transporter [Armatimonadetes bacterium]|nr:HlyC/CorC family transporter [Armatimonadota bacterium]